MLRSIKFDMSSRSFDTFNYLIINGISRTHSCLKSNLYQTTYQDYNKKIHKRTLYSSYLLGIEGFKRANEALRSSIWFEANTFLNNITKCLHNEKEVILSSDVKNLIALCEEKPEILDLTLSAALRCHDYTQKINIKPYNFGPMLMRLFYTSNNLDVALQVFEDEAYHKLFQQAASYQLIMDLLLKAEKYEKLIEILDKMLNENLFPLPHTCVTLAAAANYKINTIDSLEHSFNLLRKLRELNKLPAFRTIALVAAHALNQDKVTESVEILSESKSPNHFLIQNLNLIANCRLGRIPEVMENLRVRALIDAPKSSKLSSRTAICKDVLSKMETYILDYVIMDTGAKSESLLHNFNQLKINMNTSNILSNETLEEALFSTIDLPDGEKVEKELRRMRTSLNTRTHYKLDV